MPSLSSKVFLGSKQEKILYTVGVFLGDENKEAREKQERRLEVAAAVKTYRNKAIPGIEEGAEMF